VRTDAAGLLMALAAASVLTALLVGRLLLARLRP
ncbi:MAG: hypothetical protein QOE92_1484, partial [Chloroflexota bacterium]|nr:hypothetical protein [Chloroflexota bacterium]